MEEIILITIDEEILEIARILKKRYVKKIRPRNIIIYTSSDKEAINTSLIMRDVIKNKIIYNSVCIIIQFKKLVNELSLAFGGINRSRIILANFEQINEMVDIINNNKINYNFIKNNIISIQIQKRFTER